MSSAQETTTDTKHVGKGVIAGTPKNPRYVIDCSCGWSSSLHWSSAACKQQFQEHKDKFADDPFTAHL